MKKIKVILADNNDQMRAGIRQLLELDSSIDIVAEAATGREVIDLIITTEPELVIIDAGMPDMDGFQTSQYITLHYPWVFVIIISINDEVQNFRKAMLAGAKEYLVKPLSASELNATVRQVADLNRKCVKVQVPDVQPQAPIPSNHDNRIITVFGTKGGVGKSVISTNAAVFMAQKYKNKVSLVDLDVQFGDISIMMNLKARKTLSELVQEMDELDPELLEEYVYERNGVDVLAAPNKPELAELITARNVQSILQVCRQVYDYTFIDTPSFIDEITLTALEISDLVLLVVSLDLPTIKNVKKGIDILRSLGLIDKTRLVLNRSSGIAGIEPRDVESVLEMRIQAEVPSDGKLVVASLNQGVPFVRINARAPVSRGIMGVVRVIEE